MIKDEHQSVDIHEERAVLAAVATPSVGIERVNEYLDELAFLLETAGGVAVKKFVQNLQYRDPKTYLGSGKLEEVAIQCVTLTSDFELNYINNCHKSTPFIRFSGYPATTSDPLKDR